MFPKKYIVHVALFNIFQRFHAFMLSCGVNAPSSLPNAVSFEFETSHIVSIVIRRVRVILRVDRFQ